jgi:hypothetical protein
MQELTSSWPAMNLSFAGDAADKWRRRRQETLPRAFVKAFTPDWDWLLH